jgi:hypothetical protein
VGYNLPDSQVQLAVKLPKQANYSQRDWVVKAAKWLERAPLRAPLRAPAGIWDSHLAAKGELFALLARLQHEQATEFECWRGQKIGQETDYALLAVRVSCGKEGDGS